MAPEICPNCGADVPRDAKACPECGSCEATGWSEQAAYDGLDLPDESFDYDEFVKKEFAPAKVLPHGINWFWWAVAAIIVVLMIFALLH